MVKTQWSYLPFETWGLSCARKRERGCSAQEVKLCLVSFVCIFFHFLFLDLATLSSIRWHIARITAAVPSSGARGGTPEPPQKEGRWEKTSNIKMHLSLLFYWGASENTPLKIYRNEDPRSTPAADEHPRNLVKTLHGSSGYRSEALVYKRPAQVPRRLEKGRLPQPMHAAPRGCASTAMPLGYRTSPRFLASTALLAEVCGVGMA